MSAERRELRPEEMEAIARMAAAYPDLRHVETILASARAGVPEGRGAASTPVPAPSGPLPASTADLLLLVDRGVMGKRDALRYLERVFMLTHVPAAIAADGTFAVADGLEPPSSWWRDMLAVIGSWGLAAGVLAVLGWVFFEYLVSPSLLVVALVGLAAGGGLGWILRGWWLRRGAERGIAQPQLAPES